MSTFDFKNAYVAGMILTLLFGIGMGYQIHTWVSDDSESGDVATNVNTTTNGNSQVSTPRALPEVYARTGKVESISPDNITFTTILQNTDSTYTETTLTATITESTSFSKINLSEASDNVETITRTDIPVGSEVAISADENIYGKTQFTATSVQLHQF